MIFGALYRSSERSRPRNGRFTCRGDPCQRQNAGDGGEQESVENASSGEAGRRRAVQAGPQVHRGDRGRHPIEKQDVAIAHQREHHETADDQAMAENDATSCDGEGNGQQTQEPGKVPALTGYQAFEGEGRNVLRYLRCVRVARGGKQSLEELERQTCSRDSIRRHERTERAGSEDQHQEPGMGSGRPSGRLLPCEGEPRSIAVACVEERAHGIGADDGRPQCEQSLAIGPKNLNDGKHEQRTPGPFTTTSFELVKKYRQKNERGDDRPHEQ